MAHLSCLFRQGLYQALKGSTPSLCVHSTLEHCLVQKADLDLPWYHPFFVPVVSIYTNTKESSWVPSRRARGACLFCTDWKLGIYCGVWLASFEFVKRCFISKHCPCCSPGSTPWTVNHSRVRSPRCHLSNPALPVHPMNEYGHPKVW